MLDDCGPDLRDVALVRSRVVGDDGTRLDWDQMLDRLGLTEADIDAAD
jgi:hypothetical protein